MKKISSLFIGFNMYMTFEAIQIKHYSYSKENLDWTYYLIYMIILLLQTEQFPKPPYDEPYIYCFCYLMCIIIATIGTQNSYNNKIYSVIIIVMSMIIVAI